jgi:hypothetical protein
MTNFLPLFTRVKKYGGNDNTTLLRHAESNAKWRLVHCLPNVPGKRTDAYAVLSAHLLLGLRLEMPSCSALPLVSRHCPPPHPPKSLVLCHRFGISCSFIATSTIRSSAATQSLLLHRCHLLTATVILCCTVALLLLLLRCC